MTKAVIIIPYRHVYNAPDGIEMLLGRKQRKIHTGKLVFPGGKVEKNETTLNCAVRELYEETGIQLPPSELEYCGNLSFSNYKTRKKFGISMFIESEYPLRIQILQKKSEKKTLILS